MGKRLGLALAFVGVLTLPAAAEMAKGTVKEVDKAGHIVVLEDGTRLSVADNYVNELVAGDAVEMVYEHRGDKNIVTDIDRRTKLNDGTESTNFGSRERALTYELRPRRPPLANDSSDFLRNALRPP